MIFDINIEYMTYIIYIYIQDILFNIYIFYRIQYELKRCLGLSGGSEKNTKKRAKKAKTRNM